MIGIFDSGLGGLTALKELRRLLPDCDIVYFGDTGRVPYGTRSRETILRYAKEDIAFLLSHKADAILAACGTVSSAALPAIAKDYAVPVTGVVTPAAAEAVRATKNGVIGVIGTGATVRSGAFPREIGRIDPRIRVVSTACPLFVPLVENGFIAPDCEITRLAAEQYLPEIRASGADTVILGCTHFPIIAPIISRVLGDGVTLINSGSAAAAAVASTGAGTSGTGKTEIYVSDDPGNFEAVARIFLGEDTVPPVIPVRFDV